MRSELCVSDCHFNQNYGMCELAQRFQISLSLNVQCIYTFIYVFSLSFGSLNILTQSNDTVNRFENDASIPQLRDGRSLYGVYEPSIIRCVFLVIWTKRWSIFEILCGSLYLLLFLLFMIYCFSLSYLNIVDASFVSSMNSINRVVPFDIPNVLASESLLFLVFCNYMYKGCGNRIFFASHFILIKNLAIIRWC